MLSILCVRLTIKVKVGIPESFKVGWYPPKKTGSSHLKYLTLMSEISRLKFININAYEFGQPAILASKRAVSSVKRDRLQEQH